MPVPKACGGRCRAAWFDGIRDVGLSFLYGELLDLLAEFDPVCVFRWFFITSCKGGRMRYLLKAHFLFLSGKFERLFEFVGGTQ